MQRQWGWVAARLVSIASVAVVVGCGSSGGESGRGTDGGSGSQDGSVAGDAAPGTDTGAPPGNDATTPVDSGAGNDAAAPTDSGAGYDGTTPVDSGAPSDGSGIPVDARGETGSDASSCVGLACQIHACADGGSTTISGTILDPAGKNPLYGVVAYVPNKTPATLATGASCYACSQLYTGDPIASAISDTSGNFTITGAPDGDDIPLVIQIGKWRRQFVLPHVTECQDTVVPQQLTLPKNGSEGDMPSIAVSTGGADTLECILTRIGVDPAEYVGGAGGTGHIHIYQGGGGAGNPAPNTNPPAPSSSAALWDSIADMMAYDIVLLSCEGAETANMNQQVMMDYTNEGGRVFASHFHYAWFNTGPFAADNLATWTTGTNTIGTSLQADIVTSFAVGQAFDTWLGNVGALTNGELTIDSPRHNANVGAANVASQAWISADNASPSPGATQDFTFDTPVGVEAGEACGRVAYSDMHVATASPGTTQDYGGAPGGTVPTGCAVRDLTAQEKALEFVLFDLSSCITPGGVPQTPPL